MAGYLIGLLALTVLLIVNEATSADNPLYRPSVEGHSARAWYREAGVAADSEICGQVAVNILRHNGSTVDAGIAAQLCNGVVDQIHMGLGGGAVSLVYESPNDNPDGPKELVYISGDVTAPGWVEEHSLDYIQWLAPLWMKVDASRTVQDWQTNMILSIGVPGEIAGYFAAWERYGRLPWYEVVRPAIELAENGWEISERMAEVFFEFSEKIKFQKSLGFFKKEITPGAYVPTMYRAGDTMTDHRLANTLKTIAYHGPHAFYHGHLADLIVDDIQRLGGRVTKQDLRDHRHRFMEAVKVPVRDGDYIVYVPPAPYSGPLVAILYNTMSGYNMTTSELSTKEGLALFYHRLLEAWKYTMAHLNCIGEDFYMYEECEEMTGQMSSMEYGDKLRALISDDIAYTDMNHYSVLKQQDTVDQHGTSHLSIIGRNGAVFSSTSTIFLEFGCGAKGDQTGIIFNSALTDFYRRKEIQQKPPLFQANYLRPGKMACSMRTPVLVTDRDGNTVLTIGASGGVRIPTSIVQDLLFHLHFGLDLQEAIDYPRVATYLYPGYPSFYDKLEQEIVDMIKAKGHVNLDYYFPSFPYTGVVQAVSMLKCQGCSESGCPEDCIEAVSDHRKGGSPAGY